MTTNIDLEAESYCKDNEICKESECTHFHVIRSSDVMSAIGKLKSDKVNDNGLVYSNKFYTWYRVVVSIFKRIVYINDFSFSVIYLC